MAIRDLDTVCRAPTATALGFEHRRRCRPGDKTDQGRRRLLHFASFPLSCREYRHKSKFSWMRTNQLCTSHWDNFGGLRYPNFGFTL